MAEKDIFLQRTFSVEINKIFEGFRSCCFVQKLMKIANYQAHYSMLYRIRFNSVVLSINLPPMFCNRSQLQQSVTCTIITYLASSKRPVTSNNPRNDIKVSLPQLLQRPTEK